VSFLTTKFLTLPLWGWGAGLAGTGGLLYLKSKQPKRDGADMPGGQAVGSDYGTMDNVNATSALIENQYLGADPIANGAAFGPNVSYIDGSFFGEGPLSLWSAGPMDYSDTFHRRHREHRGRNRRRHGAQLFGYPGGNRDLFDSPPGAGGFGEHRWRGPGWPEAPPGGEGYENGGQGYVAGAGGFRARGSMPWGTGAGMPPPQMSTVGAGAGSYQVQQGDTLNSIAARFWGPGSSGEGLLQANAQAIASDGIGADYNSPLPTGLQLAIPGAPQSGPPAPGGPAGNGIGGGSIGGNGLNPGGPGVPTPPGAPPAGSAWPGQGTASAGSAGGGSPSAGQSWGNSSRTRSGNASSNYARGGGQSGVQTSNGWRASKGTPRSGGRPRGGRR
jgi:phage tail protein X